MSSWGLGRLRRPRISFLVRCGGRAAAPNQKNKFLDGLRPSKPPAGNVETKGISMQQRIYHGTVTPEGLADYLVQRFDPQHDLQAQKLGQGDSLAVQIGRGDVPEELRNAITVGITRATDSEQGIAVTLGQQHWITPKLATHAAMI